MALWVPRQDASLGTTKRTNARTRLRIARPFRLAAFVTEIHVHSQSVLTSIKNLDGCFEATAADGQRNRSFPS